MSPQPAAAVEAKQAEPEHAAGRRLLPRLAMLDRPLTSYHLIIGTTGLLLALGLVMVLSTSSASQLSNGGSPYSVFAKQLAGAIVGLPMIWVLSRMPPRLLRTIAKPVFVVAICGLVLVFFFGKSANGAERWITVAGIEVQPSEFAKLALLIWGADLLARKDELKQLNDWRALLVPLLPGSALMAMLVMLGDDLGTTFVLLVILMTLLWTIGTPGRLFVCLLGLIVFALLVLIVAKSYRSARLTGFLNQSGPIDGNPVGPNMQPIQGKWAIGSGGLFGVGLGESKLKWGWLPNASSDFIFAILGEELGLVGTSIVVFLYGGLAYAGLRVARRMTTPFMRLAAAGITVWIVVQALVNICAVIGLVPITGVPLPLISQGLSSLLVTMAAIGVLLSLARREPGAREALEAAGPGWPARLVRSRRSSPRRSPASAPPPSKVRRISGQVPTMPPARPASPRLTERADGRSRPSAAQRWPKGGDPL